MTLSISEVSKLTGLSCHTLRYYDECGLLLYVTRSSSNQRIFNQKALEWIEILNCLRETAMPLAKMQDLAGLVKQGLDTASARLILFQQHREQVMKRQVKIQQALVKIDEKIETYQAWLESDSFESDKPNS